MMTDAYDPLSPTADDTDVADNNVDVPATSATSDAAACRISGLLPGHGGIVGQDVSYVLQLDNDSSLPGESLHLQHSSPPVAVPSEPCQQKGFTAKQHETDVIAKNRAKQILEEKLLQRLASTARVCDSGSDWNTELSRGTFVPVGSVVPITSAVPRSGTTFKINSNRQSLRASTNTFFIREDVSTQSNVTTASDAVDAALSASAVLPASAADRRRGGNAVLPLSSQLSSDGDEPGNPERGCSPVSAVHVSEVRGRLPLQSATLGLTSNSSDPAPLLPASTHQVCQTKAVDIVFPICPQTVALASVAAAELHDTCAAVNSAETGDIAVPVIAPGAMNSVVKHNTAACRTNTAFTQSKGYQRSQQKDDNSRALATSESLDRRLSASRHSRSRSRSVSKPRSSCSPPPRRTPPRQSPRLTFGVSSERRREIEPLHHRRSSPSRERHRTGSGNDAPSRSRSGRFSRSSASSRHNRSRSRSASSSSFSLHCKHRSPPRNSQQHNSDSSKRRVSSQRAARHEVSPMKHTAVWRSRNRSPLSGNSRSQLTRDSNRSPSFSKSGRSRSLRGCNRSRSPRSTDRARSPRSRSRSPRSRTRSPRSRTRSPKSRMPPRSRTRSPMSRTRSSRSRSPSPKNKVRSPRRLSAKHQSRQRSSRVDYGRQSSVQDSREKEHCHRSVPDVTGSAVASDFRSPSCMKSTSRVDPSVESSDGRRSCDQVQEFYVPSLVPSLDHASPNKFAAIHELSESACSSGQPNCTSNCTVIKRTSDRCNPSSSAVRSPGCLTELPALSDLDRNHPGEQCLERSGVSSGAAGHALPTTTGVVHGNDTADNCNMWSRRRDLKERIAAESSECMPGGSAARAANDSDTTSRATAVETTDQQSITEGIIVGSRATPDVASLDAAPGAADLEIEVTSLKASTGECGSNDRRYSIDDLKRCSNLTVAANGVVAADAQHLLPLNEEHVSPVSLSGHDVASSAFEATCTQESRKENTELVCGASETLPPSAAELLTDNQASTVRECVKDDDHPPKYCKLKENRFCSKPSRRNPKLASCPCEPDGDQPCCAADNCPDASLQIECSTECSCGDSCANRRFQKCQYAPVETFKTDMKGWGLRAQSELAKGQFVIEYVGEVLDSLEFEARTQKYAKDGHEHHYFMMLNNDRIIDATEYGNDSRFINHSCDPNCVVEKWVVGRDMRIGFFTCRRVNAGEELTFDYNLVLYGKELQKCYCGAFNCRGTIGTGKQLSRAPTKKKKRGKKDLASEADLESDDLFKECKSDHADGNCLKARSIVDRMVNYRDGEDYLEPFRALAKANEACLRIFLSSYGLKCIWVFLCMNDFEGTKTDEFRIEVVRSLLVLPVRSKSAVEDAKLLELFQQWSNDLATKRQRQAAGENGNCQMEVADASTVKSGCGTSSVSCGEDSSTSAEEPAGDTASIGVCEGHDGSAGALSEDQQCTAIAVADAQQLPIKAGALDTSSPIEEEFSAANTADTLAMLLEKLIGHWNSLKTLYKIPRRQKDKDCEHSPEHGKGKMQESVAEYDREKGSYNRMASRGSLENEDSKINRSRDSSSRRTSDAHDPGDGKKSHRSRSKNSRDGENDDRKRKAEATGRSHTRPSKSSRLSAERTHVIPLSKEARRRQFEADVKAKDLMHKPDTKERTSSTSSETTPVALTMPVVSDVSVAAATSDVSAAAAAATSLALPSDSTTGTPTVVCPVPPPVQRQPVAAVYTDSYRTVYGQSLSFTTSVPPPPLTTIPPPQLTTIPPPPLTTIPPPPLTTIPPPSFATIPPPPLVPFPGITTSFHTSIQPYGTTYGCVPPLPAENSLYSSAYMMAPQSARPYNLSQAADGFSSYASMPMSTSYAPPMPTHNSYCGTPVSVAGAFSSVMNGFVASDQAAVAYQVGLPATGSNLLTTANQLQTNESARAVGRGGASLSDDEKPPPPPAPPNDSLVLPQHWKAAQDSAGRTYYYNSITKHSQWHLPVPEPASSAGSVTPTVDEPRQRRKTKKTTRAAADTSSADGSSKWSKEFKSKVSECVRSCLNAFYRETCTVGRITSEDDYKYLARKLTRAILEKESKHGQRTEDLKFTDSVKSKAKDYVRGYMLKQGAIFARQKKSQ